MKTKRECLIILTFQYQLAAFAFEFLFADLAVEVPRTITYLDVKEHL